MRDAEVERVGHRGLVRDDHHVGPRHHHLACDGVTELDDRFDQLSLLVLDHLTLRSGLDDAEELLLADERTALEAAAPHDDVGQADQAGGDQLQWSEGDERPHGARRHHRRPVGMQNRVGLRHRLGEHEEDDHVEGDADDDTDAAEEPAGDDARQCRLDGLTDVDREQQRVDPPLRRLHKSLEARPSARPLLQKGGGSRFRHLREAHLGHREEHEHEQQHTDRDEHQHVGAGHLSGDHSVGAHERCSAENPAGTGPFQ